jgi:tetratricopeptide (TPR) repeat protein
VTGAIFRVLFLTGIVAVGNCRAGDAVAARDHLNQGVNAFKTGDYARAADEFRFALGTDPAFGIARLYLATAYEQQFVPDVDTPENKKYWQAATDEFQNVLNDQPSATNRLLATQSIASLYYLSKDMTSASDWYKKVIELDPNSKEAYYTLGVIAWLNFLPADRAARNESGMQAPEQVPLRPDTNGKTIKADLKARYWQSLTDGIDYENKALEIDPEYENAMSYENLLIRYRADLEDTQESYEADAREADSWMTKALSTTKAKAARSGAGLGTDVPMPSPPQ